jgi:glyoxylase-like metal-dependent hydrolase (beta-lactamase superfamily II)
VTLDGASSPNSDWFYWRETRTGLWMIAEPGHVYTWLVVGTERACLVDTGLGIEPIRPVVESITRLPVTVVNTHFHFDHVGGNWEFDDILVHPEGRADVGRSLPTQVTDGYTDFVLAREQRLPAFRDTDADYFGFLTAETEPRSLPADFRERLGRRREAGASVGTIGEGDVLDLGGRSLRVLHTPGHSRDGLVLHDEREGLLLVGDTFNRGLIYCHFADSSLTDYRKSARRLAGLSADLQCVAAHHVAQLVGEPAELVRLADALDQVDDVEPVPTVDVFGQACLAARVGEFTVTLPDPSQPAPIV